MATPISDAESDVMQVLWRKAPRSAEEVIEALAATRDWQDATVKTLLNRLLNKGAIRAEKDGRRYLYAPLLSQPSSSVPTMPQRPQPASVRHSSTAQAAANRFFICPHTPSLVISF